jgi:hypothetical protein
LFERVEAAGVEHVAFCHDPAAGLRALVVIGSTRRGPALCGVRIHAYADTDAAAPAHRAGRVGLGHRAHPQPARARFRRLARRFGRGNEKKAAVAVAHTLARIAWTVMKNDQDYAEAAEDYYDRLDQRNRDHIVRHHQQALTRLGYQVTLSPPGDSRPPPAQAA